MLGLTAPSVVKSAITLAIYKKHVLVSLIHLGESPLCGCRTIKMNGWVAFTNRCVTNLMYAVLEYSPEASHHTLLD